MERHIADLLGSPGVLGSRFGKKHLEAFVGERTWRAASFAIGSGCVHFSILGILMLKILFKNLAPVAFSGQDGFSDAFGLPCFIRLILGGPFQFWFSFQKIEKPK
jgi:hypothetical protein